MNRKNRTPDTVTKKERGRRNMT